MLFKTPATVNPEVSFVYVQHSTLGGDLPSVSVLSLSRNSQSSCPLVMSIVQKSSPVCLSIQLQYTSVSDTHSTRSRYTHDA